MSRIIYPLSLIFGCIGIRVIMGDNECLLLTPEGPNLLSFDLLCPNPGSSGMTLAAVNQFCNDDCYCDHGAPSGGACGTHPLDSSRQTCLCNYTSPPLPQNSVTDAYCETINSGPPVRPNSACYLPSLLLPNLCNQTCRCFHGANSGACQIFTVGDNPEKNYCKCSY